VLRNSSKADVFLRPSANKVKKKKESGGEKQNK
jgi:hypothetical protein